VIPEPGDILTSRGDYAVFQVQFNKEGGRWWPCWLERGGVWLVIDVSPFDVVSAKVSARLFPLNGNIDMTWWIEGSVDEWCTLDKVA
jgi:hypothetical protein